jgi:hypothetical protein
MKSLSSLESVVAIGSAGVPGRTSSGADVVRVDEVSVSGFLQPTASASESVATEIGIHGLFISSSFESSARRGWEQEPIQQEVCGSASAPRAELHAK